MKRLICTVALLLLALPAWAQSDKDFSKEPGYVEFGDLVDLSDGEEVVEVFLTQPLLGITKWAIIEEDPELAEMIGGLKLLRVNVFSFEPEKAESIEARIEEVSDQLSQRRWDRIVKVRGESEHLNVFVHIDETGGSDDAPMLNGLAIVAMNKEDDSDRRHHDWEDNQAVFVNIVGQIDFGKLSSLGRHFNIPQLDQLDEDDYDDRRGGRGGR